MPLGNSKEEQELTARLAAGLVQKEVIEPMSKIGWGHGTPPPPDYSGQPAKVEGAPAPAPAPVAPAQGGQPAPAQPSAPQPAAPAKATPPATPADLAALYESLRDPETGLIGKKYKTVEEAIKGSGHLANMAKQSFSERDAALAELSRLREENLRLRTSPAADHAAAPSPAPVASAPSRASVDEAQKKLDAVLASIEENGGVLDVEALRSVNQASVELAEAKADFRVKEALASRDNAENAERAKWEAVDDFMRKEHPDSLRFADEIGLHIASDPLLQQAVAALVKDGKEKEASVLAWKSYQQAEGAGVTAKEQADARTKEVELAAQEQARKEALEKARRDAGVVQGSAGGQGVHQGPGEGAGASDRAEIEASRSQMRIEGDAPGSPAAARFRHLIIGRYLDPAIFPPVTR